MKDFKNILFINYGGIGDEILFIPTIKSAKEKFPNSKITLALEPRSKSVQNLVNFIDEIISVDIKAKGFKKYFNVLKFISSCWFKGFDCVISSGKSPLVAIILFLTFIKERIGYDSKFGFLLTKKVMLNENQYAGKMYHDLIKPVSDIEYKDPEIDIPSEYKLPEILENKEYIVIHPGVSKMSVLKNILKCPKLHFWQALIKDLLHKNKNIVLLGTNDDKDLIEELLKDDEILNNPNFINYFKKTKNLLDMALIMKNAKYVICVDSAPLHVAVCTKSKTFAIFGPTNEEKLVPKRDDIMVVKNDIDCRPCLWHKRNYNCEHSKCLEIDYKTISDKIN